MVIIITETSRAPHELPKHDVADRVSAPPVGVSASDLLGLVPTLLLHAVREASGVGIRGDSEVFEERGCVLDDELAV